LNHLEPRCASGNGSVYYRGNVETKRLGTRGAFSSMNTAKKENQSSAVDDHPGSSKVCGLAWIRAEPQKSSARPPTVIRPFTRSAELNPARAHGHFIAGDGWHGGHEKLHNGFA